MVWLDIWRRTPVAMTIAGSDSGGGAGIEADLKVFAALGVHGTAAITAVTAQNTVTVTGVQGISPEIVKAQIEAVVSDIGVDAAKTGMLYTAEIIKAVAEEVRKHRFPLVVDPVMIAKSGAPLLKPEAMKALVEEIIPLATVVTPNAHEAAAIAGFKVKNLDDQKRAAKAIAELGPKAVVVKGGHVSGDTATDILYYEGEYYTFEAPRLNLRTTHGTGCGFSAAITAYLARGCGVVEAVSKAKEFITLAIRYGVPVGKRHGPINPLADLYRESERYRTWREVLEALEILQGNSEVATLVPEVGMNVAAAIPYAHAVEDVVAVPGRIRKVLNGVAAAAPPEFGASSHLARYILAIMRYDPLKRAAINIRYDEKVLEFLRRRGLRISYYDRTREPPDVKSREGATIPWGVEEAIKNLGAVPDVIYHKGDWGKEPMIVLLGESPVKLARLVVQIAKEVG